MGGPRFGVQYGVVGAIAVTVLPMGYVGGYFAFGDVTVLDFLYAWVPVALVLLAVIISIRHGRLAGFTHREYGMVGSWATGIGLFVGGSVLITLAIQSWKAGRVVDSWFIVANWTLTGTAIGALIGIYDSDRRLHARETESAVARNARLAQQLSVLNRVLRHDVRTAVNVIDGYAEFIQPETDRERLAVDTIRDRTSHLACIANNARILQDLLTAENRSEVDIGLYLRDRLTTFDDRHPPLSVNSDVGPGATAFVPSMFPAALDVALDIAVENNTRIGAELSVGCRQTVHDGDRCVVITIADNGPALTEVERVVYESAEETPLEHASGVDLWLVKWAVEEAQGSFAFDTSEDWNRMTIRVPAA